MSWYIARRDMPQIDAAQEPALMDWLKQIGVKVIETVLQPDQIRFHQHVNRNRTFTMPQVIYDKPVWVSREGYTLDGNHRACAHRMRGDPVKCHLIDLPFWAALMALDSFEGTYSYGDGQAHASY